MSLIQSMVRRIEKRTQTALKMPTVAPSGDHTDGSWIDTDIYPGEIYLNLADKKLYSSDGAAIFSIQADSPTLSDVLTNGNQTLGSDIEVTAGDEIAFLNGLYKNKLRTSTLGADRILYLPDENGIIATRNYVDTSVAGYIPLAGTLTGSPLTGAIKVNVTNSDFALWTDINATHGFSIGSSNSSAYGSATHGNMIFFDTPVGDEDRIDIKSFQTGSGGFQVIHSVGYNSGVLSQYYENTPVNKYTQSQIYQNTFIVDSSYTTFAGIQYTSGAATKVVTNQNQYSLLHRGAGDARWLQLTGGTMTGTINWNPSSNNVTALGSITRDFTVGAGNNIDLYGTATIASYTKYGTGGIYTAQSIFSGTNVASMGMNSSNLTLYRSNGFQNTTIQFSDTDVLIQFQDSQTTGYYTQSRTYLNRIEVKSINPAFYGLAYESATAGYVANLSNQTQYSLLHRAAGDARWLQISTAVNGYVPLAGTLPGHPLTGPIEFTTGTTALRSASTDFSIGQGNNADLTAATTYGYARFNAFSIDLFASDGSTATNLEVNQLEIDLQATIGSDVTSMNFGLNGINLGSSRTGYGGITYDSSGTSAKVISNQTDYTLLHRGANDLRYLRLSGGTMTGNLILNSDATSALQAVTYQQLNAAVVGLYDLRGGYNASGNVFPSTGGSGSGGAVMKADVWIITVAGTLGGTAVTAGDEVIALVDSPGQTAGNWNIMSHDIGYTPLSNVLTSAYIFVGNSSNVATGVAVSGDVTISNAGVVSIGSGKVTNAMLNGSITASKLVGTDIATVGTITTGTWQGTAIADNFLAVSYIKADGSRALTANWSAGAFNIASQSQTVNGTGGNGYMELLTQSSAVGAGAANSVRLFSNAGLFAWVRASDGFVRNLDSTLTANRTFTLPDVSTTIVGKTGTMAANYVGYWNDANQLTGANTLTYDGTTLKIGTVAAANSSTPFVVTGSANNLTIASVQLTNTSTGAAAGSGFSLWESTTKYGALYHYNNSYTGNYTGTSIAIANSTTLGTQLTSALGDGVLVLQGTPIYALPGTTSTNWGWKQDATGLRIDQITNLNSANTKQFAVGTTLTWDTTIFSVGASSGTQYATFGGATRVSAASRVVVIPNNGQTSAFMEFQDGSGTLDYYFGRNSSAFIIQSNAKTNASISVTRSSGQVTIGNDTDGSTLMITAIGGNTRHVFSTTSSGAHAQILTGNSVDLRLGSTSASIFINSSNKTTIGVPQTVGDYTKTLMVVSNTNTTTIGDSEVIRVVGPNAAGSVSEIGFIDFSAGTGYKAAATIGAVTITSTNYTTKALVFSTRTDSASNLAPTERLRLTPEGYLSYNAGSSNAAWLDLKAGSTTVIPIKLTSGSLATSALAGGLEFLTDDFYATITTGTARKKIVLDDGTNLTSGNMPSITTNGRLTNAAFTENEVQLAEITALRHLSGN